MIFNLTACGGKKSDSASSVKEAKKGGDAGYYVMVSATEDGATMG